MRRFFVEPDQIAGQTVTITGQEAHHITDVLRLVPGIHILVCCGDGLAHRCALVSVASTHCTAQVLSTCASLSEPRIKLTLYQGIPKGDKLEDICQKGTELGISAFVPVQCTRSISIWKDKDQPKKLERLAKIVRAACKQSGRALVPAVLPPCRPADIPARGHELVLVAYEEESSISLTKAVANCKATDVALFIGPEGGIDPSEIQALLAKGAVSVSLGRRILRTETAPIAAAAIIFSINGDMDI